MKIKNFCRACTTDFASVADRLLERLEELADDVFLGLLDTWRIRQRELTPRHSERAQVANRVPYGGLKTFDARKFILGLTANANECLYERLLHVVTGLEL